MIRININWNTRSYFIAVHINKSFEIYFNIFDEWDLISLIKAMRAGRSIGKLVEFRSFEQEGTCRK